MLPALVAQAVAAEARRARHSLAAYCLVVAVVGLAAAHLADVYGPLL